MTASSERWLSATATPPASRHRANGSAMWTWLLGWGSAGTSWKLCILMYTMR